MNWQLNKESIEPLYQQLINEIKTKIKLGQLSPGERLPSDRKLAQILQVNRSTVIRSYDELTAEGLLSRKRGSGTTVSYEAQLIASKGVNWKNYLSSDNTPTTSYKNELMKQLSNNQEATIDGYTGELPQNLIPSFSLTHLNWHDFLKVSEENDKLGILALRRSLVSLIKEQLGYLMSINEVLLTAGGQQSLFFIMKALLKSGETVAIESPSYFYSLPMFENSGIKTVNIPLDDEGISVEYLEKMLVYNKIKMLFVTPTFQNPTTISMSLERRKALIALCEKNQIVIVEDDVYSLLAYQPKKIPTLKELAPESVIYLGSLTKVLGKTIQLGWINAPRDVLEAFIKVREDWDQELSVFPQMIVKQWMEEYEVAGLLNELRSRLLEKMTYFYSLVCAELSDLYECKMPQGGYYIWLTHKKKSLTIASWEVLLTHHILVFPSFFISDSAQSIRINVANLTNEQLLTLVNYLKKIR